MAKMSEIFAQHRANLALLASCQQPHRFAPIEPNPRGESRCKCSVCGGVVDAPDAWWYEQGLAVGLGEASKLIANRSAE